MPPTELYRVHRPRLFKQLRGQPQATKILLGWLKKGLPHVLLAIGPSGTGKTTAFRILRNKLDCTAHNFHEWNAADFKGIDMVRDIRKNIEYRPLGGKSKIYLLDECQKLTNDAQNALLKVTEDTPDYAYFMFATTEPGKLLPTLRGRCSVIPFKAIKMADMKALVLEVAEKESIKLGKDVADTICEMADGSAREALQYLGTIQGVKPSSQLDCLTKAALQTQAFDLVKVLMPWKGSPVWASVAKVLKGLEAEDGEGLRQLLLKVCASHMLKGGPMALPAFNVYQCIKESLYANKINGLVGMCFDVVHPPGK